MGEKTKLGLGIAGVALVLGLLGDILLRATPWGLNVFLFALPLVGLAASLAVALLNALNPDALIVRTNLARAESGQNLDAAYLASLSADAVPPLLAALPRLPEADRRTIEAGIRARWTGPMPGDLCTYNLSLSRAREAVDQSLSTVPGVQAREIIR